MINRINKYLERRIINTDQFNIISNILEHSYQLQNKPYIAIQQKNIDQIFCSRNKIFKQVKNKTQQINLKGLNQMNSESNKQAIATDYNPKVALKRKERDIAKLLMSDFKILQNKPCKQFHELTLQFDGPKNTPYEEGSWEVYVLIPEQYPYKSPSIGFINKIFHPNIDFQSGSVCLDVINQTWSPMYELINIFDIFLPQLLTYPNPKDPLNPEAAMILIKDQNIFNQVVQDFVKKYAPKKHALLKTHSTQDQYQCSEKFLNDAKQSLENLQRSQSQSQNDTMSSSTSSQTKLTSTNTSNDQQTKFINNINTINHKELSFQKNNSLNQVQNVKQKYYDEEEEEKQNNVYKGEAADKEQIEEEEEELYCGSVQQLSEISQTSCSELSQSEIDKECVQEY
ncbi:ubiquitin-conjugating enzyme (macronuclear) [Tetrahymena thermophila SB210]|uniref:Ubiquitin-conjugating enzyme E2 H n=1 Tax=Tetrahymena thermophila (strain SB210) TaxID=312017 RepID=I7MA95_TETTS|nr:ubiquitin-conjugating enzyme [Tetrahymena thermophila SB210]EAS03958.2 ubiquitin-conjugating enzyme [Tetrahymena thermophila SB210]|eukprot:XP_001024203.2 ubiquitin-conjugating enzyme [Tetrahymena thermophila SB210]